MMKKYFSLFGILFFNLSIGNLVVFIVASHIPWYYHGIISVIVSVLIICFYFFIIHSYKITKKTLILLSLLLSVLSMIVACILVSVGGRLPSDSIFEASIKGILPLSVFALFFTFPVWIILAIINYFGFKAIVSKIYQEKK